MKFRVKMTLCMLGLLSLLFGIGGSALISLSFQNSLGREKDAAWQSYQMSFQTLQIVNELETSLDYERMSHTLEQLSQQSFASWAAMRLESAEEIIYEYGDIAIQSGAELPREGQCLFRYSAEEEGRRLLILSGAVNADGEILYLHAVYDISPLYELRTNQERTFLWVFAGMAILCAALSFTVSSLLTAPLTGLSRTSRALAKGRYGSRVRICSSDEIGEVSADFNAMADKLEEVIAQLRDTAERQESFMGSFAHELKTPMTSVIGYSELLLSGTLSHDEQMEAAGYIYSEGRRLETLSHKLLDLLVVKRNDLPLKLSSPGNLIASMVAELKPVYRAQNITLACRSEGGACLMEPDLIRSLLMNLIDNSRKAMEGGGSIGISCEMTGEGCRIRVLDNGRGIPNDALNHLTEAFYRVDKSRSRAQGGVGLGLALCREIVDFHHGDLRFENRPGGGVCVTVELRRGRA